MSRDLVSSLFWLAVAIFAVVQGAALKLGTLNRPGPGFFPFWGGVVLGVLVLVLLANTVGKRAARSVTAFKSSKLLVVAGALLGYVVLLETLGFVAVSFLFLLLLLRLEGRGWASSVLTALLGTLGSYALFQLWLKTQLPIGPLGF
jgi:hypothetical protein